MIRFLLTTIIFGLLFPLLCHAQGIAIKRNPKTDPNLSPNTNKSINPEQNSAINPKYNWNLNPEHNTELNPLLNDTINPKKNTGINPNKNRMLNPMYRNELHPKNPTWKGWYMFDKDDELLGYVSPASQMVILVFDINCKWTGYLIKSGTGTYNFFNSDDEWTGQFGCFDGMMGYNFFEKGGEWKGVYVK